MEIAHRLLVLMQTAHRGFNIPAPTDSPGLPVALNHAVPRLVIAEIVVDHVLYQ